MDRSFGRSAFELRPVRVSSGVLVDKDSSVVVEYGRTRVLCVASVEERAPPWMKGKSPGGWLTAEYGMLPGSSNTRIKREASAGRQSPRTQEIQRLIGRALRASLDLSRLGERTITIDCDVLQADGGTRTASVTGGFVALARLVAKLQRSGLLNEGPIIRPVAAVSVGIVAGNILVDMDYAEDSIADVDLNVVADPRGGLIEIQGTAEREPFSQPQLAHMIELAAKSLQPVFEIQRQCIAEH